MDYEVIVGLEIHAELSTKSKAYCSCENSFGGDINSKSCEVCTGLPGALPKLNEKSVEYAVKMGHALNCKINNLSKQDRKNYFYPDLPKAFQVSQNDIPICGEGYLDIIVDEKSVRIGIERIHIEEDSGKLIHSDDFEGTLIDLNRSGVPLIEIVTKPDIRSPEEARTFLETVRQILIYLGISDGKMQEGSIRCDVNVSIRKKGASELGTRIEMKNVNTFSGAARAVEYEFQRQISIIESGNEVMQETRKWDDASGKNILLRDNEADYMFLPEPDLGTIYVSEEYVKNLKDTLPELPNEKILRYMKNYELSQYDATLIVANIDYAKFFEEVVEYSNITPGNIANWILGDITRLLREHKIELIGSKLTPKKLYEMIRLVEEGKISNAAGKVILEIIIVSDKKVEDIINEKNLVQISDNSFIEQIVKEVLDENPSAVEEYHNGRTNVVGFLVGQGMKKSKGQANPATLNKIMMNLLGK